MLNTSSTRVLGDADLRRARAVAAQDPVANVFVASRLLATNSMAPWLLRAQVWGWSRSGDLDAVCWSGANLVPVQADEQAARAFADQALAQGRVCSSMVGPARAVGALWDRLRPAWGPARDERLDQPLLATSTEPLIRADPRVRRVRPGEVDLLVPACVSMYSEEVGVSPIGSDAGRSYRNRVLELVRAGHSFARIDNGQVVFKAELGAVSRDACQVQGVWTHPEHRGRGLASAGVAAVVRDALRTVAPTVSLYVNDFNVPARAVYDRVGFHRVGTFASVLF